MIDAFLEGLGLGFGAVLGFAAAVALFVVGITLVN
jgi:hypothetical protein